MTLALCLPLQVAVTCARLNRLRAASSRLGCLAAAAERADAEAAAAAAAAATAGDAVLALEHAEREVEAAAADGAGEPQLGVLQHTYMQAMR